MSSEEADRGERVVLSRGDTCLREADVALLQPCQWLNDNLITFYFGELATAAPADDSVLLVDGSVAFFLAHCDPEDAAVVTAPLRAGTRELIMLAINDNQSVSTANGGSHWTLLAYRRSASASAFVHYDSLARSGNLAVAARVAKTLAAALGLPPDRARVVAAPAPQQANGYDCGCHVLLTAQLLCQLHKRAPGSEPTQAALEAHVTPAAAKALRAETLALITRLAAEDVPWDD